MFPDKTAVVCGEARLTYGEVDRLSDGLALTLKARGIRRHSRVAIFLDNSAESVIAVYGALKAGCVFVVLSGAMKAGKLACILRDSGASALVTHVRKRAEAQKALDAAKDVSFVIWAGDGGKVPEGPGNIPWQEAVRACAPGPGGRTHGAGEIERVLDQDLAALVYTSGSSGEPRGVMSSHQNVVSAAGSIIRYLGNTPDDVILSALPLSFDYGLYQVIMAFMFGGTVVLSDSFMYTAVILETIAREKVTGFPIVPTIAALLLKMNNLGAYDLGSLRYITNTGAALPVEHIRKLRKALPRVEIFSMFGLTECKRVCYLPPSEIDRIPTSVGKAMPNCEVFLLRENGEEARPGEVGEMVVRGPNVMRGYWNAPGLTERTFRDGAVPGEKVLYTGDFFKKDADGFLYFLGRKDDMIKTRGERVSPREVENVISGIEGVFEAAVVGVQDELMGQAVKAFVVRNGDGSLGQTDILRHCRDNLEPRMVPRFIEFVHALPRTPNGKVDKKALRESGGPE